ncbi:efflux RND transporter periplasmic adaptor subunit [Bacteroides stercorirosoris]|uniref:Efflux RND transporter periplasmic adaptor subunit n=1 Tax=Bacteroides stercorirosoris TaxID=871324 RepID=A0A413H495_9BACE|nr:efflux RND transporter periplasmic adaptor subunit [Bacteroides stercorirosoris]RGX78205.1 efflux RND transporter periplasmic adaptor subunit [Bacteroides stercorirosoris]
MMKTQNYRLLLCLALFMLTACSGAKKEEAADEGVTTVLPDEKNEVTVVTLKRQTFNHELVSNGKVVAGGMADLRFESSGIVAQIYVKNGDRVRKGQKLAELDKFRLKNKTAQSKDALEKSKLELQDVLIGQGYVADDTAKVPDDIMQLARVKSGYDQSLSQYELAKYEEEHATLVAPFEGVVANLFSKPYNAAGTSDAFCTIIGIQGMEADFTVLESELPLIKSGDKVVVTPYADPSAKYEGRISEINPLVDDKGMVKVKAVVNGQGKLFSGMNIRVNVYRSLGEQLVIPKSSVVLRSGKQVVFTLEDGKAKWNYVHTGLENAESYTVADDGVKEGDMVIVTGNVNLAHEAPVIIKN